MSTPPRRPRTKTELRRGQAREPKAPVWQGPDATSAEEQSMLLVPPPDDAEESPPPPPEEDEPGKDSRA